MSSNRSERGHAGLEGVGCEPHVNRESRPRPAGFEPFLKETDVYIGLGTLLVILILVLVLS